MTKHEQIVVKLVEQNTNKPDYHNSCQGTSCHGVDCSGCPFSDNEDGEMTLGKLRESIKPSVTDDGVRKPSHYQVFDGVESIEIIARSMTVSEFRGFCMGNVLKYRLRAGKKSELATMEKDLNKAAFYQELFDLHKGKCYDSK